MAVVCRKCGKTVSEKINACYNCGELLHAPVKCTGCNRDNVFGRTQCQYCGTGLPAPAEAAAPAAALLTATPAAGAPPKKSGGTRLSFEDDAPPAKKSAPPPPASARPTSVPAPPAKAFEVIQMPVVKPSLLTPERIDLALLILALPVAVWGMLLQFLIACVTMGKFGGKPFAIFERLLNPSWWTFIPSALIGTAAAYFLQRGSKPSNSFSVRHAFTLAIISCVFGLILLIRRIIRNRPRRRSKANELFRP